MNIAIIDDQDDIKYAIEKILKKEGHTCYGFCGNEEDLLDGLKVFDIELIILDMMLEKDLSGLNIIQKLKKEKFDISIIMITAYTTPSNLIEASKSGIIDIIQKPFSAKDIVQTVNKYLPTHTSKINLKKIAKKEFIGSFETMKEIYKSIGLSAKNDSNILIIGDTGTGKDLVAKLIHENSINARKPFVAINCSTIPENLFEKLMYGKVENFSKNQNQAHIGHIQKVGEGTLYLDEINELHPSLQVKLLRFLETKSFYPLGSANEIKFKGRIICASSRKKSELENSEVFRSDLYYRISTFEIELPSLKDRKNDIKELVLYFIKTHCQLLKIKEKRVSEDVIEFLKECDLKGNVRELKNIIYKAILNSRNEMIFLEDIENNINNTDSQKIIVLKKITEEILNVYDLEESKNIFEDFENIMLEALFNKCNNISKLSNHLGITRNTLKSKFKKYNLDYKDYK